LYPKEWNIKEDKWEVEDMLANTQIIEHSNEGEKDHAQGP
jgi:hypothetical protein